MKAVTNEGYDNEFVSSSKNAFLFVPNRKAAVVAVLIDKLDEGCSSKEFQF